MTCVSEIDAGLSGPLITTHLQTDDRLAGFQFVLTEMTFVPFRLFWSYRRFTVITSLKKNTHTIFKLKNKKTEREKRKKKKGKRFLHV